jgi:hypothetical protein
MRVFEALAHPGEPCRQSTQELNYNIGPRTQQRVEVASIDDDQIGCLHRDHRRRALTIGEQADFPDDLARIDETKHQIVALVGSRDDLQASRSYDIDLRTTVPLVEELGPGTHATRGRYLRDRIEIVGRKSREEGNTAQDGTLLFEGQLRHVDIMATRPKSSRSPD